MITMRAFPVLGLLAFAAPALAGSQCDKCPTPSIMFYDTDATPYRPDDSSASNPRAVEYTELMMAGGGYFATLQNNDSNGSCFDLSDVHFNTQTHTVTPDDPWHPVMPWSEAASSSRADYVASSVILPKLDGSGAHVLTVKIEDPIFQEWAAKSEVEFAKADDALKAGGQAEGQVAPLLNKVRDYQKKKRDENQDMAINARFDVFTVGKPRIDVKETTTLSLTLSDCDGTPLGNRVVKVKAGPAVKLSKSTVTTDSSGQATVQVTGVQQGFAAISARYEYTTVTHHRANATGGLTRIQVADPLTEVWQAELELQSHLESHKFAETRAGNSHNYSEQSELSLVSASLVAWLPIDTSDGGFSSRGFINVEGDGTLTGTSRDFQSFEDHVHRQRALTVADKFGHLSNLDPETGAGIDFGIEKTEDGAVVSLSALQFNGSMRSQQDTYYGDIGSKPQIGHGGNTVEMPVGVMAFFPLKATLKCDDAKEPKHCSADYSLNSESDSDSAGHSVVTYQLKLTLKRLKKSQTR